MVARRRRLKQVGCMQINLSLLSAAAATMINRQNTPCLLESLACKLNASSHGDALTERRRGYVHNWDPWLLGTTTIKEVLVGIVMSWHIMSCWADKKKTPLVAFSGVCFNKIAIHIKIYCVMMAMSFAYTRVHWSTLRHTTVYLMYVEIDWSDRMSWGELSWTVKEKSKDRGCDSPSFVLELVYVPLVYMYLTTLPCRLTGSHC